jgi:hypothetical protein
MTFPTDKDAIKLVAEQIIGCPPPLNTLSATQTMSAIILAASVPGEALEEKCLKLLGKTDFKGRPALSYLALDAVFRGQAEPEANSLADFLVKQGAPLFKPLPFPSSPSTATILDVKDDLAQYAASLFSSNGFKWPHFASWVKSKAGDAEFLKKLRTNFLALSQVQQYKLLVDLILVLSKLCTPTDWLAPFNFEGIYLVRLALHRRRFFKAFEKWVRLTGQSVDSDPCYGRRDSQMVDENADLGHFDGNDSSIRLACAAFARYGRVAPEVAGRVEVF